jgi:hypothetical protein
VIIRKATDADVVYILERLCEQHKSEHKSLGLTRGDALAKIRQWMRIGDAEVALLDDKPIAAVGIFPEHGVMTTFVIATDTYFRLGVRALRHARRYMAGLTAKYGPIFGTTASTHPDAVRWVKACGGVDVGGGIYRIG